MSDLIGKLRGAGEFSTEVGSRAEAEELAGRAFPDFEEVPEAIDPEGEYPQPQTKQHYQVHPAGESTDPRPHIKYEDWTGGKKNRGGSWGHIWWQ